MLPKNRGIKINGVVGEIGERTSHFQDILTKGMKYCYSDYPKVGFAEYDVDFQCPMRNLEAPFYLHFKKTSRPATLVGNRV